MMAWQMDPDERDRYNAGFQTALELRQYEQRETESNRETETDTTRQ
jgi:hypothetical protein